MRQDLPSFEMSPSDAAALHDCCERFEKVCREGGLAKIEEFVAGFEGELRLWAARELAYIENYYRRSAPAVRGPVLALSDADGGRPNLHTEETIDHHRTPTGRSPYETDLPRWPEVPNDVLRFREVRPFAAGGIGQISLALDLQIQREVALKRLQAQHQDDCDKCDRFCLEAQITGSLEHPGVVPIYALGVDAQQRPYYAMRLIRGKSMRSAIRELHQRPKHPRAFSRNDIEFRDLLARFAGVCQTMSYAHSRGVLHRDLKPDNVMLGKYGETYVVDWGMARVMAARGDAYSLVTEEVVRPAGYHADSATQYGSAMGTPGYMSPEQAAGLLDELTAATDIYSLGAILYCVLTDRSPISGVGVSEFFRKVAAGDFDAPHLLNKRVPLALSSICLKALATAPQDRYTSARDLSRDIENWMADEPLQGISECRTERLGRLVRRNYRWLAPASAASMLVALIALIAMIAINRSRQAAENAALAEKRARDRAEAYFVKTRQTVDTWLTGYSEALQHIPLPGVQSVRAHMLELASHEYESFAKEQTEDPLIRLEQGRTLIRLGSIHRLLGRPDEAEQSYNQGIALLRRLLSSPQTRQSAAIALALAEGLLAQTNADLGDFEGAERHFAAALAAIEQPSSAEEPPGERLQALSTLWTNRGGVLAKSGRYADADQAFKKALSRAKRLLEIQPNDLAARVSLATAQLGAGQIELVQGKAQAAAQTFEEASDLLAAAVAIDDRHLGRLQLGVTAYSYLAAARRRLGDLEGEVDAYANALAQAEQLAALQPEVPAFHANVAMMRTDLGQVYVETYDVKHGEELLAAATTSLTEITARFPQIPEYREAGAAALINQAHARLIQGAFSESLSLLNKAESELQGLAQEYPEVTPYSERLAAVRSLKAQALFLAGRTGEAYAAFTDAANKFDELASQGELSPDHKHAEATFFARYARALGPGHELVPDVADRALRAWRQLLAESKDPQYAASAAMFFALCDDPKCHDPREAVALADAAIQANANNPRFTLALAAAYAFNGDWEKLRAHRGNQDADNPIAPAFDYFEALAQDAAGVSAESVKLFKSAATWTNATFPGDWDLTAIQERIGKRLRLDMSDRTPN